MVDRVTSPHSATAPVDLSVDLAGLHLANPVMTCSGTSGYGPEYGSVLDLRRLGAFVTKSVTPEPRKGNAPQRIVETPGGMLNAIGLANVGLERFVADKIPFLRELGVPVIVNVAGHTQDDYLRVCEKLDDIECISALELNVSCPNVADGLEFGTDPRRLAQLVSAVRRCVRRAKLVVKLSPNVTDIAVMAEASVSAGADVLSLINTLRGMAIHVDTRRPMLANRCGGLSGPAIKPVALYMVHEVYSRVAKSAGVPLIGMGGIANWRDAVEFLLAGASAVGIGTALFINPGCAADICDGLAAHVQRAGLRCVRELTGKLES